MIRLPEISVTHQGAVGIDYTPLHGWHVRKGEEWPHDSWCVSFTYQGRTYTTSYKTGIGHRRHARGEPPAYHEDYRSVKIDAKAVLESLFSDAQSGSETFDDWCSGSGYDTDSRKALDTYLACQRIGTELRRLLGSDYSAVEAAVMGRDEA